MSKTWKWSWLARPRPRLKSLARPRPRPRLSYFMGLLCWNFFSSHYKMILPKTDTFPNIELAAYIVEGRIRSFFCLRRLTEDLSIFSRTPDASGPSRTSPRCSPPSTARRRRSTWTAGWSPDHRTRCPSPAWRTDAATHHTAFTPCYSSRRSWERGGEVRGRPQVGILPFTKLNLCSFLIITLYTIIFNSIQTRPNRRSFRSGVIYCKSIT